MENETFYQKLKKFNKPSNLIKGFFNQELYKKINGKKAIDLGAGVRK